MNNLELEFGCGRGADFHKAWYENMMGDCDPYEICGLCGEDIEDCLCYSRQAERDQFEADHQWDIREDG